MWGWKHLSNPFGRSIVLVAESNGRIAGVRAMMQWKLRTPAGHTISCLRPVDTATHPDFHRQGVFKRLTMEALEIAREDGVHLVFNTPNEKSAPGYLKMGWKAVSEIGVMVRPCFGRAVAPAEGTPPSMSQLGPGLRREQSDRMLIGDDREPQGLRTPRTAEYISWRFSGHPTASYGWIDDDATEGCLVARAGSRNGRSELVISDLLGSPSSRIIGRAARNARARYLAGWFSPTSLERRIALLGGVLPIPFLHTLRLVALPLTQLDIDVSDLSTWDLSTSDLELL